VGVATGASECVGVDMGRMRKLAQDGNKGDDGPDVTGEV
jgi:hypothetical protein